MSKGTASKSGATIETLEEAAAWLEGLINVERAPDIPYRRLGLEPIQALLARLGHPERTAPIVHVAGSKGKGSTCLLVESLLGELGLRTGTFTSPHLVSWTERFRIAGHEVDGRELARAVDTVRPHVEALRDDPNVAPTFFDATTAAALVVFARAEVDAIVLEVGLGGRLDSTNAVTPVVTAITSIELEHTDRLGDTLGAIAGEKAGILKPGVPGVIGALPDEAMQVVRQRAVEVDAPLSVSGDHFTVDADPVGAKADSGPGTPTSCTWRSADGARVAFELGPSGRHQIGNAGIALGLVRAFAKVDDAALGESATRAWRDLVLAGRLEHLGGVPPCLVDAAHTPASARELALHLDALAPEGIVLVLSVSADKAVDDVLAPLLTRARTAIVTCAEPIRSLAADALALHVRALAPGLEVIVEPEVAAACAVACSVAHSGELVCAAGSVYLAGAAREVFSRRPSA